MQGVELVIELLKHQEINSLQKFINTYWSKGHIFSAEKSIFDWQYKESAEYFCMSAKQGKELIGIQGFIPQCHFDKNLPYDQIFLALWVAREKCGIGIGLQCYDQIIRSYSPKFLAAVGINPKAIPFHLWQKFKVGIMDHHVALSPLVKKFKIAAVPSDIIFTKKGAPSSVSFNKITESSLKNLDTSNLYLHQTPIKSDIYIKNRFFVHPVYKYKVYAIFKKGRLQALCALRPILHEGVTVLRIVDFIGPNEAFALLSDFILGMLEEYDAEYIDLYSHGVQIELLEQAGFINRKKVNNLIIPNYFEPFEQKNIDLTFAYKTIQTLPPVRLFKADGDQDRPQRLN